jgi:hypothetical protein
VTYPGVRPRAASVSHTVLPEVCEAGHLHSQIDQDLARAWLWGIKLLDLGRDRARIVIDKSLIRLGDLDGRHLD